MKLYSNFSIVIAAVIALSCISCAPTDPRAELQEAHALMQKKQFDAALPRTRSCLDINHENVDAIVANALCVYNMTPRDPNECKNARLNLSRATSTLAPDRFDAWYAYTWVLMQEQDYDNALNAARRARNLFRSQRKPPIPISDACDASDAALAKSNPPYANLILMIADISRHNGLTDGLPFFNVVFGISTFTELPELYLAYSQLLLVAGRTREAYRVISNATKKFSDNLPCAYNYALIDEYRRRGLKLPVSERYKVIHKFERAESIARKYGEEALANRIAAKVSQLRSQL